MPPVFKALITVAVWILFVKGCLAILLSTILVVMARPMMTGQASLVDVVMAGVGIAALILAAAGAKLRQMVE